MDAHCLIRCHRELIRRVGSADLDGHPLPGMVMIPMLPLAVARTKREKPDGVNLPFTVKVVDEWDAVIAMVEQLQREPFFSFATQQIKEGPVLR